MTSSSGSGASSVQTAAASHAALAKSERIAAAPGRPMGAGLPFAHHLRGRLGDHTLRGAAGALVPAAPMTNKGDRLCEEARVISCGGRAARGEGARDEDVGQAGSLLSESSRENERWRMAVPDELDPMARALRAQVPPAGSVHAGPGADAPDLVAHATRFSLDHLLSRFVRRIAWSGDGRAGSARIEFGAGELDGATLILHATGSDLDVSLDLPPGVDRAVWKDRIARRLSARGLQVTSLDVG